MSQRKKCFLGLFFCFFLSMVCVVFVNDVLAADASLKPGEVEVVFDPILKDTSVFVDADEKPPIDPNVLKAKYLEIKPPASVEERVQRLIHGIEVEIPPEYDHYGYEIRHLMASVGNPKIFEDEDFLKKQIVNVRKSAVVVEFWQKALQQEIDDLEKKIDLSGPEITTVSLLKQNKAIVRSFMVSLKGWIDSNERYLLKVFDSFGLYDVYYPEIIFLRAHERIDFFNLLQVKQSKLKEIRKYPPFAIMVY